MAWFRADDKTVEHPKFISARAQGGYAAVGVWFHAGTWSNAQMTDGFIPRSWAILNRTEDEISVLVEVGLFHEDASRDGWQMHDYSDYQPTRAELEEKRAKDLERKKRGGSRTVQTDSARNPDGIQNNSGSPVPVPVPVSTAKAVERARRVSPKESRNRKRLGLEPIEGGAT
jgi:hypothetical protein